MAGYYSRRAASEVGLILSEGTVINRPASKNLLNIPDFYGNEALQGWKNVIDQVHAEGGKMGPQIWHVGDTRMIKEYPEVPMEAAATMSIADIEDTIKQFAASAKAAKDLDLTVWKYMVHTDTLSISSFGKVQIPEPMNMAEKH